MCFAMWMPRQHYHKPHKLYLSTGCNEQPRRLFVRAFKSSLQWSHFIIARTIDICTITDEQLNDDVVAVLCGHQERRRTVLAGGVNVCAGTQEQFGALL